MSPRGVLGAVAVVVVGVGAVLSPVPSGSTTGQGSTTTVPVVDVATASAVAVRGSARPVAASSSPTPVERASSSPDPTVPALTPEEAAAVWCYVNTCHPVPEVERWHHLAIEVDLVDEGILTGPRSWACWSLIVHDESRGDPSAFGVYPANDPYGLVQVDGDSWVRYLRDLGVITAKRDLFDPRTNLLAAVVIRDYQNGSVFPAWGATGRRSLCS